jgi:hypothetical protein
MLKGAASITAEARGEGWVPRLNSDSTTTPKKGGLFLTPKGSLISHGVHRVLRESRFSHDKQEIAYLSPIGGKQSFRSHFALSALRARATLSSFEGGAGVRSKGKTHSPA